MISGSIKGRLRPVLLGGFCFAALMGVSACSQSGLSAGFDSATSAPTVPVSQFSDEGLASLDAVMQSGVTRQEVHGLSYLLVSGNEEIARNYFGVKDPETGDPIAEDTIFRVYSMTKPITGVAMMMLWEEGKWDLDDPVTDYIPEFADLKVLNGTNEDGSPVLVDMERPPTMREVMAHTAGFAYGLGGDDYSNTAFRERRILRSPDLPAFIDAAAEVPLLFQPGTNWAYSASVDIQGYIVEKLSGQRFGEFLDERIFTPLGMDDAGFFVPEDEYDRLSGVFTYSPEYGRLVNAVSPTSEFRESTVPMESGGGGLLMTLDDYAAFCQMLLNEGRYDGQRLLKPETIKLMATDVLPEGVSIWSDGNVGANSRGAGQGFGLDFGIVVDPEAAGSGQGPGSYYWGGAAGTWFWIDPVNNLYFIGMIQRFSGNPESDLDLRAVSRDAVYTSLEN